MRGPEEWPSSRSNPADRIRLTGPAATNDSVGSFDSAQDFACGLPLRSRPQNRLNLQVRLPQMIPWGPSTPLRISPAGSRFAHARKPAQLTGPAATTDSWGPSTPLRISPAGSRFAHARKPAQLTGPAATNFFIPAQKHNRGIRVAPKKPLWGLVPRFVRGELHL